MIKNKEEGKIGLQHVHAPTVFRLILIYSNFTAYDIYSDEKVINFLASGFGSSRQILGIVHGK